MANIREAIEFAKQNPDTPFASELRRRIESGQMNNELKNAGIMLPTAKKEGGIIATIKDIPSDIKEAFTGATQSVTRGLETADKTVQQVASGEISPVAGTLKTIGGGFRAGADVVGQAVVGTGKLFTSPKTEESIARGLETGVQSIIQTQPVQTLIQKYESLTPEQKAIVDGTLGVTEGLTTLFGAGPAASTARRGISTSLDVAADVATRGANLAGDVVTRAGQLVEPTVDLARRGTQAVTDVARSTGVQRIPQRVATNIEARRATEQAIKELPTETAKKAVRDGIDIGDVREIENIKTNVDKTLARQLLDTAKQVDSGNRAIDPIEIVGKPIVEKIKQVDIQANKIGQKLGEVAKNLGVVTKPELVDAVFNRLKSVPGLQGLKLKNGSLDFSDSTIRSAFTQADRKAIQQAFIEATRWGSGTRAHKFRQELFEVLDGKKRALENITSTQERALNAVRQGLADVLESKNPSYKKLSQEYASIVQPLGEIRKLIRATGDISEDILEMNAGLIARRLTSTGITQGQVRNVLRALDAVSKGKVTQSTEALQDLYNILNRYYEIAPRTGFQGGIKEGVRGISEMAGDVVKEIGGQTKAVRQKALEDLLTQILK